MSSRVRKFFESESIFHSARPFHILSKFCGLSLYKFDAKTGEVKTSILNLIFLLSFLISLTIFSSFFVVKILIPQLGSTQRNLLEELKDYSPFLDNVVVYEIALLIIYSYFLIIYDFVERKKVQDFFQALHEFDVAHNAAEAFGEIKNSTFDMLLVISIPIVEFAIFQAKFLIEAKFHLMNCVLKTAMILVFVSFSMIFFVPSLRFIYAMIALRKRLEIVNKKLR